MTAPVFVFEPSPGARRVLLDGASWARTGVDLLAFDRVVHAAEDDGERFVLLVDVEGVPPRCAPRVVEQIRLRYARLQPRVNAASASEAFARARAAHAALFDRAKPLVRADHDHAIDAWQWTLRLDRDADAAVQLAALFHDVERLSSEADRRVEHHAVDYQAFKDAHAAKGARTAYEVLGSAGVDEDTAARAAALIARHERREEGTKLLGDADALSFFGLNLAGYVAYFGPAQTAKKVAWTRARLSSEAAAWLPRLRLPDGVVVPAPSTGAQH